MTGRILVVDDEDTLRLTLKTRLSTGGFQVDSATDGEEALEKLKTGGFDVMLLDINMPKMDGITALGIATELYPQTDIIMLTGFADFTTAIECLKKGAKDYLVKPIDTTELVTRLRSLLRARTSEAALENFKKRDAGVFFDDVLAPVGAMKSMIELLAGEGTKKKGEHAPLIEYLGGLAENLRQTVAAVIDASSLAPPQTLRFQSVPFEKIMAPVSDFGAMTAGLRGLKFEKKIDGKIAKIDCDPERLSFAFQRLLLWAVGVSAKGATITLHSAKKEGKREELLVEVSTDKDREKVRKIAEQFARNTDTLGSDLTRADEAIIAVHAVKRLLQAHGGKIHGELKSKGGFTIQCTMPIKRG